MASQNLEDRIVILGGAGFLGSHVVETFLRHGYQNITIVDSLTEVLYQSHERRGWLKNLSDSSISFIEKDFTSDASLQVCAEANTVINLAAVAGLRKSWDEPLRVIETNFLKFHMLVDFLQKLDCPPYLIHASTSSIYGENAIGDESSPRKPISPYGISKLAAEFTLESVRQSSRLDWCSLRFFSIYGPRQRDDMAYHRLIRASIDEEKFQVFGSGLQRRSNTYVTDAADAVLLTYSLKPSRMALNIAGNESISLNEAIEILKGLGAPVEIIRDNSFPGDQMNTLGDASLARKVLGWTAKVSFETGIANQLNYQRRKLSAT